MNTSIKISDYDYPLPEERIARFPLGERDASRLLVSRPGGISERGFREIAAELPEEAMLVFNNTKVIRARIVMHKPSGARIEIFCLEPHAPADYERAFAVRGGSEWKCIVGNAKKWKTGSLEITFDHTGRQEFFRAERVVDGGDSGSVATEKNGVGNGEQIVRFTWSPELTFGQALEQLGRIPIPPYLGRESEAIDERRYQTVYSKLEGSVAAPTAGLHFTENLLDGLRQKYLLDEVTLHVGAGTFLPVKSDEVTAHAMHTEHFEITARAIENLIARAGKIVAVGTTTVRTLESLACLGRRVMQKGDPQTETPVGQWEPYSVPEDAGGVELLRALLGYMRSAGVDSLKASTRIMIIPGYRFRVTNAMVTNFHQPKSTLLLLVSAFIGERWRGVYDHALGGGFRFLSYGDSCLLFP